MSIHVSAIVDPRAVIDPSAEIGPHAVIDGPARVGPECRIAPFAVVLGATELGPGCRVHSHAVIGDLPQDRAFEGAESFCRIGRECIIREGVTIHRGTAAGSATEIGDRCYLMTNSHVGHNCVLEDDVTLISGALLGGHVHVGRRAVISGNAAVHQFVRIGELAMVSGLGKIVQDVPPYLMADRDGTIVGVNRVGLLRSGMGPRERREVKEAYRLLYRSGLGRAAALAAFAAVVATEVGERLLAFLEAESPRGITREVAQRSRAA
ncbi:MAG: acyl-ACP--UDP-N-acetylglucosamine O-acyltransferase [Planctomycetales bacterium]